MARSNGATIQWTERMSVGVPLLDSDHRVFIRHVNLLEATAKPDIPSSVTKNSLTVLDRYAKYHFAREERVMRACGFPAIDGHMSEHTEFAAFFSGLRRRLAGDPDAPLGEPMLDFVKQWLNHHILVQDMAYRPYAEGNAQAGLAAKTFPLFDMDTV